MSSGLALDLGALIMVLIISRIVALWVPAKTASHKVIAWLFVGLPVAVGFTGVFLFFLLWFLASPTMPGLPPNIRHLLEARDKDAARTAN